LSVSILEINAGSPLNVGARQYSIQWMADALGTIVLDVDTFMAPICTGSLVNLSLPCKGAYFRINPSDAVTTTNATITMTVYGSYRPRSRQKFRIVPSGINNLSGTVSGFETGDTGVFTMNASPAAGATVIDYPIMFSGPAVLHCQQTTTSTGTVAPQITISHMVDSRRIAWGTIPIGQFGTLNIPLYLPKEPVIIAVNNSASNANTFSISLSMDGYAY